MASREAVHHRLYSKCCEKKHMNSLTVPEKNRCCRHLASWESKGVDLCSQWLHAVVDMREGTGDGLSPLIAAD